MTFVNLLVFIKTQFTVFLEFITTKVGHKFMLTSRINHGFSHTSLWAEILVEGHKNDLKSCP